MRVSLFQAGISYQWLYWWMLVPSTPFKPRYKLKVESVGHPFIHLPYAWKLQSPAVATEPLSLGCTEYTELHGLLDQYPPGSSTYKSTSLADIIKRVHDDNRFDDLFTNPGITNMGPCCKTASKLFWSTGTHGKRRILFNSWSNVATYSFCWVLGPATESASSISS